MLMNSNVLEALNSLNVAELNYEEWIRVGMALKAEGYDCSVWDAWSMNDRRYRSGECGRKWETFRGNSVPLTGGTIIRMAQERGWNRDGEDSCMGWDDRIQEDGNTDRETSMKRISESQAWNPAEELITYIRTLFKPDEYVGYVTNDVWQSEDGKWMPAKGNYDRKAAQLIAAIEKYPDDLGAAIGDCNPEAGAWIRINPVDGCGVKNENVTQFRYALVESDTMPIEKQYEMLTKLELPIACLVHSGGKSLHAIVRVDAANMAEYRQRVAFLYDYLAKQGMQIDVQNKNPSRLSRMPGVMRNGKRQYLMVCNIGRKNWQDWMETIDSDSSGMPGVVCLADFKDHLPTLPDELIHGILRCGHKMLISGSSKAGKSFLLMELCIAIAEGEKWLGFQCKKGRVLYVNLEIDPASCIMRFMKIYQALGIKDQHMEDIEIWNLRGHAVPLDQLVPKLIQKAENKCFDAIIVDPIYKVITGDENNASEMAAFCNQFDRICTATGCASIYCHHHSKGTQGSKRAMDRASGSGVFARDPDAQLDMIQLELTDEMQNEVGDGQATAWRLESSLREFENIVPVNFWFDYPIHRIDTEGSLDGAAAEGSFKAVRAKNRKCTSKEERRKSMETAYEACSHEQPVTVKAMAEYLGVTERCVRDRLQEVNDTFWYKNGTVGKCSDK